MRNCKPEVAGPRMAGHIHASQRKSCTAGIACHCYGGLESVHFTHLSTERRAHAHQQTSTHQKIRLAVWHSAHLASMAPTAAWQLLLLLLAVLAASAAAAPTTKTSTDTQPAPPEAPAPAPWPERFRAVLFTNLTNYSVASTGPPLRMTELYYDWPRRRNLNLVRHQLGDPADPLYDVEWGNGTTFYYNSSACRVEVFPVGVLPPWWISGGGAAYMGRESAGGIDCHVWGKAGFIVYYEEAATGRPVRWDFIDVTGIKQYVMSFEPGVALEDSQWQAPAHCFPLLDGDTDDEQSRSDDREVADGGIEAAARLLRKLAGAATGLQSLHDSVG
ncbi:hypothetical protein ACP70R_022958 [Stipagrostis hirtigluma subsp. patula]